MELTLVGTGTSGGVPMIGCHCAVCRSTDPKDQRLRSSAFLTTDDGRRIAIDCGPDFRQQMLREGAEDLDAIVFTHEHKDHTAGLDDVRAINFLRKKPIQVYATQQVLDALTRQYDYIFLPTDYGGLPKLEFTILDGTTPFLVCGEEFVPIPVYHHKLPVLGFRIRDVAYVTDANRITELGMERLNQLDVLVLDALRKEPHISHFSLDEALALAQALAPKQTLLTHISHHMGCHETVSKELPDGVSLGFDGVKHYF